MWHKICIDVPPGQDNTGDGCTIDEVPNIFEGEPSDHSGPYNGALVVLLPLDGARLKYLISRRYDGLLDGIETGLRLHCVVSSCSNVAQSPIYCASSM